MFLFLKNEIPAIFVNVETNMDKRCLLISSSLSSVLPSVFLNAKVFRNSERFLRFFKVRFSKGGPRTARASKGFQVQKKKLKPPFSSLGGFPVFQQCQGALFLNFFFIGVGFFCREFAISFLLSWRKVLPERFF